MNLPPDTDLLRQFVDSHSPQAFAALVERYLPLIYSSALRQTRDPHLAEDVAQATLIIFSQRAVRIDPPILVGWLLKTTHFVARNALRQQFRRARYEQRAAAMKRETQPPTESPDADAISKLIDPALAKLRDADRTAVVLRYFQNKSFADIAASMNTTEAAVQKRVSRAVLKLREILAGQGITVVPAALPALLGSLKLHPVPPSLSLHASTLSSAKSAFTSSLAKGALKIMAATKLKISVATIVAFLLVAASVPVVYEYIHQPTQAQQMQSSAATTPSVVWLPKGTDLSKPISGSLPPGMVAEPIGIMRLANGRWMTPTGDQLTNLPTELNTHLATLKMKGATHAFLFRIKSQIASDERHVQMVQPSLQGLRREFMTAWSDPPTSDQIQIQYELRVIEPKPGADSITLSIDVADGPWTNIGAISASATDPVQNAVPGFPATLFPPTHDQQGVHVKCDESNLPRDQDMYFCGILLNGDEMDSYSMLTRAVNTTYDLPGKLADFKEFRLDVRPINYHATYAPVPLIR